MEIRLESISKRYGTTQALNEVSLTIQPGSIVAVLGLNGAGKSTLLCTLAGLLTPDNGQYVLGGTPFHRDNIELRREILFIPDTPLMFHEKSVLQNIASFVQIYEKDEAFDENEIADLMEEIDLSSCLHKTVSSLSRGQVWKTALTYAAAIQPSLWLVDEPFASGMDAVGISAFKRIARAMAAKGNVIIYTTQLPELATDFSDHIALLHKGTLDVWKDTVSVKASLSGEEDSLGILKRLEGRRE